MNAESHESFIGRTLDKRWRLDRLIGKGGMGYVFEGRQLSVDRPIAVKLIREDAASETRIISRFFREAQILSQLHHPHVVTLYDFGQDEETGALFMVMERVRGRPLSELIEQRERLTVAEIFELIEQLLGALAVVHQAEIVHRDLKPENILIERRPQGLHATLIDFGVARIDEPQLTRLTQTGVLQGTPHFMAPEQIEGEPSTGRSDLYALGVVLYEVLAGVSPFPGETLMSILMQHLSGTPEPLRVCWALPEPLHEGLAELVHDLLQKRPEQRPASAAAALERLRALRGEEAPAPRAPQAPPEPAPQPAAPADPAAPEQAPATRALGATFDSWSAPELEDDAPAPPLWTPARRALVGAVAALGLILAGLVLYILGRDEAPPREAPPAASTPLQPPASAAEPPDQVAAAPASAAPEEPAVTAPLTSTAAPASAPTPTRTRRGSTRDLKNVLDGMRQP